MGLLKPKHPRVCGEHVIHIIFDNIQSGSSRQSMGKYTKLILLLILKRKVIRSPLLKVI
jgi:hypothetical protein